jgi:hypothetical protein
MKKLFIAAITSASLLLAAAPASATNIAYGKNSVGGLIVLTTTRGSCAAGTSYAYGTSSTGEVTLTGCWRYNEPVVSVYWRESGESRQYQAGAFTITDEWKKIDDARRASASAGM